MVWCHWPTGAYALLGMYTWAPFWITLVSQLVPHLAHVGWALVFRTKIHDGQFLVQQWTLCQGQRWTLAGWHCPLHLGPCLLHGLGGGLLVSLHGLVPFGVAHGLLRTSWCSHSCGWPSWTSWPWHWSWGPWQLEGWAGLL